MAGMSGSKLNYVNSCLIFDAMDRMGIDVRVLDVTIGPLIENTTLIGPAFTLQGVSDITDEQKKLSRRFFEEIRWGDILIIDTGDSHGVGHWGELMSHGAKSRGASGVILNGGLRDSRKVKALGLPVFHQYTTPFESGNQYCIGDWQKPISMPGVTGRPIEVVPGDMVVADDDGIILIKMEEFDAVVDMANEIWQREQRTIIDIGEVSHVNEAFLKNNVV